MQIYHGTSQQTAQDLASGNVDVTLGGGELGQGFYTGEELHNAKTWAFNRFGDRTANVVEFDVDDTAVLNMNLTIIDGPQATLIRSNIRRSSATRTYRFSCDMVWAPIVGSDRINGTQHKWESRSTERYLNGSTCPKAIV
ncbi:hypothetical protein ASC90_21440 [Rhizobium sp. Root1220]|nr:hypothetical protein ASC90_21440 [Rhizobium sp. Root1220]